MKNKLIMSALIFALLQAISAKGADAESSLDDGPLTIYLDAGKDIDSILSSTKNIEKKQRRIDTLLKGMAAKIEELEKRPTYYNTDVAAPYKRAAELACEKLTNDLRTTGGSKFTNMPNQVLWLIDSADDYGSCVGALIDKRFFLTTADCLYSKNYTSLSFVKTSRDRKKIKATHIHPDYSAEHNAVNNIALIELESAEDYDPDLFPVCLYTSQMNPRNDLLGSEVKIEIIAYDNCSAKIGTRLRSSYICTKNLASKCTRSGEPIFVSESGFPKYQLFGLVADTVCYYDPVVITRVFDHLEFIETIVWPKSGN